MDRCMRARWLSVSSQLSRKRESVWYFYNWTNIRDQIHNLSQAWKIYLVCNTNTFLLLAAEISTPDFGSLDLFSSLGVHTPALGGVVFIIIEGVVIIIEGGVALFWFIKSIFLAVRNEGISDVIVGTIDFEHFQFTCGGLLCRIKRCSLKSNITIHILLTVTFPWYKKSHLNSPLGLLRIQCTHHNYTGNICQSVS